MALPREHHMLDMARGAVSSGLRTGRLSAGGYMWAQVLSDGDLTALRIDVNQPGNYLTPQQRAFFREHPEYCKLLLLGVFSPAGYDFDSKPASKQRLKISLMLLNSAEKECSLYESQFLWEALVRGTITPHQAQNLVLEPKFKKYHRSMTDLVNRGYLSIFQALNLSLEAAQTFSLPAIQMLLSNGALFAEQVINNPLVVQNVVSNVIAMMELNRSTFKPLNFMELPPAVMRLIILQKVNTAEFRKLKNHFDDYLAELVPATAERIALAKSQLRALTDAQIGHLTNPVIAMVHLELREDFIRIARHDLKGGAQFFIKDMLTSKLKSALLAKGWQESQIEAYYAHKPDQFNNLAAWLIDNTPDSITSYSTFFNLVNTPEFIKVMLDTEVQEERMAFFRQFLTQAAAASIAYPLQSPIAEVTIGLEVAGSAESLSVRYRLDPHVVPFASGRSATAAPAATLSTTPGVVFADTAGLALARGISGPVRSTRLRKVRSADEVVPVAMGVLNTIFPAAETGVGLRRLDSDSSAGSLMNEI